MIILGIDPGTVRVGFGIIKKDKNVLQYIKSGLIAIPAQSKPERLIALNHGLEQLIAQYKPKAVGVEGLYFTKNKKTAIQVAEARGVILVVLAQNSIPVIELSPLEVKSAVAGSGRASKDAVSKMVAYFLNFDTKKMIDDETDALALAITTATRIRI